MDEMITSGEVVVTPLARELAGAILRPVRFFPARLATKAAVIEALLLPRPIRDGYGLRAGRPAVTVMAMGRRATRMMLPLVPAPLRMLPAARNAHRRSA